MRERERERKGEIDGAIKAFRFALSRCSPLTTFSKKLLHPKKSVQQKQRHPRVQARRARRRRQPCRLAAGREQDCRGEWGCRSGEEGLGGLGGGELGGRRGGGRGHGCRRRRRRRRKICSRCFRCRSEGDGGHTRVKRPGPFGVRPETRFCLCCFCCCRRGSEARGSSRGAGAEALGLGRSSRRRSCCPRHCFLLFFQSPCFFDRAPAQGQAESGGAPHHGEEGRAGREAGKGSLGKRERERGRKRIREKNEGMETQTL